MQNGRTQSQERRASAIMFLKSDLIFGLLLLSLVNHGNAGAAAEIGLIKKLLTTIFDRFEQLGKGFKPGQVQIGHGQFARGGRADNGRPEKVSKDNQQTNMMINQRWRNDVGRRLADLEIVLGTHRKEMQVREAKVTLLSSI